MTLRDIKLAIAIGEESPEIKGVNDFFDEVFGGLERYIVMDSEFYNNTYYVKNNKLVLIKQLEPDFLRFDYFLILKKFEGIIKYIDMGDITIFMVEKYLNIKKFTPSYIMESDYKTFDFYKNQNLLQLIV